MNALPAQEQWIVARGLSEGKLPTAGLIAALVGKKTDRRAGAAEPRRGPVAQRRG